MIASGAGINSRSVPCRATFSTLFLFTHLEDTVVDVFYYGGVIGEGWSMSGPEYIVQHDSIMMGY